MTDKTDLYITKKSLGPAPNQGLERLTADQWAAQVAQAESAFHAGDVGQAIDIYQRGIARGIHNVAALQTLGDLYLAQITGEDRDGHCSGCDDIPDPYRAALLHGHHGSPDPPRGTAPCCVIVPLKMIGRPSAHREGPVGPSHLSNTNTCQGDCD